EPIRLPIIAPPRGPPLWDVVSALALKFLSVIRRGPPRSILTSVRTTNVRGFGQPRVEGAVDAIGHRYKEIFLVVQGWQDDLLHERDQHVQRVQTLGSHRAHPVPRRGASAGDEGDQRDPRRSAENQPRPRPR